MLHPLNLKLGASPGATIRNWILMWSFTPNGLYHSTMSPLLSLGKITTLLLKILVLHFNYSLLRNRIYTFTQSCQNSYSLQAKSIYLHVAMLPSYRNHTARYVVTTGKMCSFIGFFKFVKTDEHNSNYVHQFSKTDEHNLCSSDWHVTDKHIYVP
jgi:hypothetical protein